MSPTAAKKTAAATPAASNGHAEFSLADVAAQAQIGDLNEAARGAGNAVPNPFLDTVKALVAAMVERDGKRVATKQGTVTVPGTPEDAPFKRVATALNDAGAAHNVTIKKSHNLSKDGQPVRTTVTFWPVKRQTRVGAGRKPANGAQPSA